MVDGKKGLACFGGRRGRITEGEFIAIFNGLLFLAAAIFIDIETAMYTMLTYFAASKTVDFVVDGIEEYIGVTIISPYYEKIKEVITHELQHGVTVYMSDGGFHDPKGKPRAVLYCVLTRFEITRLLREIEDIDPNAFVVQNSLRDVTGGRFKRLPHR